MVGTDIADDLFGPYRHRWETISVDGRSFLIVGVLADAERIADGQRNSNIIIPYTTAQRNVLYFRRGLLHGRRGIERARRCGGEADLTEELMSRFKDEDAFSVMNQSTILESMDSITNTMAMMFGGIAGISLLVGGIGIMNIMLVSVAERTREIGIRKAIGAGRKRILLQFLIEALVVSTWRPHRPRSFVGAACHTLPRDGYDLHHVRRRRPACRLVLDSNWRNFRHQPGQQGRENAADRSAAD